MSQDDDDKADKADKAKADKPDKADKAKADKPDKPKADKPDKPDKAKAAKANKPDDADKDDKVAKVAKPDKTDKADKVGKADKAGKADKTDPADNDDEDDDIEDAKRRYLLRRFWESASGFWRGNARKVSWFLTGSLLATIVVQLVIQYQLTVWNWVIFDGLETKNADVVLFQAMIFPVLAIASVSSWVVLVYLRMTTQRRWRRWLTSHVIDRWLGDGRYYQLNLVKGDHENPEYRIAEDLRIATESPVEFVVGIVSALLSAATFIVVLWTIGGSLTVPLGANTITIPGFLVIGAVVYAIIASGSMLLIGRRFVRVAENKNQAEAEYRYVLTRLRENGESIALIRGEAEERAGLEASITNVLRRWRDVCFQHMRTTIVYQGSGILAPVVPIILSAPKFLDGSMTLGQVMQAASAFVIVQTAFSWLVDNYPRFADWTASARRVASLMVSLDTLDRAEEAGVGQIDVRRDGGRGTSSVGLVGDARRRHGRGQRRRCRDPAGRESPGRRRVRGPARARWCAPSRDCGRGAAASSTSKPARGCSCCRSGPTSRSARCGAPSPTRAASMTWHTRRSPTPWSRSASAPSSNASTKTRTGISLSPAARSSGSRSRASSCTSPTSS